MTTGLVYILTNPCLDGWVKIGMTKRNDVRERLKELNSPTNIPLSYQCYATYEVENPQEVEQSVHRLIDTVDLNLHARETLSNGKIRQREFFKLSPETAFNILQEVATLRGDVDKLQLYSIKKEEELVPVAVEPITLVNESNLTIESETTTTRENGRKREFKRVRKKPCKTQSTKPNSNPFNITRVYQ